MSGVSMLLILVSLGFGQETAKIDHDHSKLDMGGMNMNEMQMAPEFNDDNLAMAYAQSGSNNFFQFP